MIGVQCEQRRNVIVNDTSLKRRASSLLTQRKRFRSVNESHGDCTCEIRSQTIRGGDKRKSYTPHDLADVPSAANAAKGRAAFAADRSFKTRRLRFSGSGVLAYNYNCIPGVGGVGGRGSNPPTVAVVQEAFCVKRLLRRCALRIKRLLHSFFPEIRKNIFTDLRFRGIIRR